MAQKPQQLYWSPASHLGAAYHLRHQAPQLVGRLAHPLRAAAKMAARGSRMPQPKLGSLLGSPKSPLAVRPAGASVKPIQPAVPRMGPPLSINPPAGSAFPSQLSGGLAASAMPAAVQSPVPTGLPKLLSI